MMDHKGQIEVSDRI